MKLRQRLTVGVLAPLVLMLAACSAPAPKYNATVDNLRALKSNITTPIGTGKFQIDPSKPQLNTIVSRTYTLESPVGNSFADYLKEAVKTELAAAGLHQENSSLQLSATILENQLDVGIKRGTARMSVNFRLDGVNGKLFEQVVTADAVWDSSFMGAIAIPLGIDNYLALYKQAIGKLISHPGFIAATKTPQ
ncbi:MAG: hypothetical protein EPO06_05770 [Burkholderiaceae bacterium]|nr:MAG: hypothetical protein EPO06_05770 [Burkholderiaceae bacterium]